VPHLPALWLFQIDGMKCCAVLCHGTGGQQLASLEAMPKLGAS
jgi:hypothetical protein